MSKITAIVSAYYSEEFIAMRLLNLFGQKPFPEIVVVCQKGSHEHEVSARLDVKLVTTPDIPTIGKAWNLAIAEATGDYIVTANTDDLFYIGALVRMAKVLDDNPEVDLVFGDCDITNNRVDMRPWKRCHEPEGIIANMYEQLQRRCFIGPMPMFRKSSMAFDEDCIVACDYAMWLSMGKAGCNFYYIPDALGLYHNRADSLEHRNTAIMRKENERIRCELK